MKGKERGNNGKGKEERDAKRRNGRKEKVEVALDGIKEKWWYEEIKWNWMVLKRSDDMKK